jgi:hypothetical protein
MITPASGTHNPRAMPGASMQAGAAQLLQAQTWCKATRRHCQTVQLAPTQ